MEIFYVLLILLVITRAFGEIAVRLGQPALVGELLAGIVLGAAIRFSPSSFPVRAPEKNNATSCLSFGPPPALHPPTHISICADGYALVTNQNPAPS